MKAVLITIAIILCVFLASSEARRSHKVPTRHNMKGIPNLKAGEFCSTCVDFMTQTIDTLIEIIANGGIIGGCSDLCGLLNNSVETDICQILCDVVGIDEFINLINDADPDPIWICEEVTFCPVNPSCAANIVSGVMTPAKGPDGTKFTYTIVYNVTNTIGTGQVGLVVIPPNSDGSEPFGDFVLIVEQAPGEYKAEFQFQATPSEQETFTPGVYQVEGAVCESTCGSNHSNAKILSTAMTQFTISK